MQKRLIPLAILVGIFLLSYVSGVHNYLSFENLKSNHEALKELVEDHYLLAPVIFMLVYIVSTSASIPGGAILTIAGGVMFGLFWGTLYVVIGATIGATIIFYFAKTSLGEHLREKAIPWLEKLSKGFEKNALSYMLFLRFLPIFPFFVVNLVPAFLNVRTKTFVLGTFFGIIPGTFVYVSIGNSLDAYFTKGSFLTPEFLIASIGLAMLSLLPIVYKHRK